MPEQPKAAPIQQGRPKSGGCGAFLGGVIVGGLIFVVVGFVLRAYFDEATRPEKALDHTIAIVWDGEYGKYGEAFYGAQAYLVPQDGGFSVRARVMIGGDYYQVNPVELGVVKGDVQLARAAAARQWGRIDWQPDGLYVGTGENRHFTPRERIQAHR